MRPPRPERQVLAEAVRGGHHLTREQLAARLRDEGFAATGFGLAYVIMHAEISGSCQRVAGAQSWQCPEAHLRPL
nr:hypothetical protein [Pseudarthrobacter psychrotolerans]